MTLFSLWLKYGMKRGWVSRPHCATHDGVFNTHEEELEWDEGGDPCQHILRLW